MKRGNWRERKGSYKRRRGGGLHSWFRVNPQTVATDEEWGSYSDAGPSNSASQFRPESSSASLPEASSSASASNSAPELPGFYFDPEKNRYFRLLPGHNNCNPLTREQIQQKEREKQRQKKLAEDEKLRKKAPRVGLNSTLLLQKKHMGMLPENSYRRLVHEMKVSGMRRHKLEIQSSDEGSYDVDNMENFRLILGDSACERVFTVHDVSHGGCKYGIMNFGSNSRGSLYVEMCENLYFTNRKVNSICWASLNYQDSHVLLCLVGTPDTPGCVSLLPISLFSDSNPDQPGMLGNFKIPSAWSCAWCDNPQFDKTFSTGLSRRVITKNVETGRTQTYPSNSDVLAQHFAQRVPVLFNGCRSGEIFGIDVRQRGGRNHSWKAGRFHQESAITCLRVLMDENYLLAADMLGQIKLWDVRATKVVQEYKGHHDEHARLPIHVKEEEGLLLAVGQDCYTRLWSLKDGHLLREIPSPYPAGNDMIPSVIFSSYLGSSTGLPGMLMAVERDLYYFPYNTDYQD